MTFGSTVYRAAPGPSLKSGGTNVWGSADAIDAKRLEVERVALSRLLAEAARTWSGIEEQFSVAALKDVRQWFPTSTL